MEAQTERGQGAHHRRSIALAHPAAPDDSTGGWEIACARTECANTFLTPTKQRRYCSDTCRRIVERAEQRLADRIEGLLLAECAAADCRNLFIPAGGRAYCSAACRKRAHRAAGDLVARRCGWCRASLADRSRRAEYCDPTCRQRAHRARQRNTDT